MTSRDFAYWLQGYFEIAQEASVTVGLTPAQVDVIRRHLAMVFVHEIDPSFPAQQQSALDTAHACATSDATEANGPTAKTPGSVSPAWAGGSAGKATVYRC